MYYSSSNANRQNANASSGRISLMSKVHLSLFKLNWNISAIAIKLPSLLKCTIFQFERVATRRLRCWLDAEARVVKITYRDTFNFIRSHIVLQSVWNILSNWAIEQGGFLAHNAYLQQGPSMYVTKTQNQNKREAFGRFQFVPFNPLGDKLQ